MKLYSVRLIVSHGDSETILVVANDLDEAKEKALAKYDDYVYGAYPHLIEEVDGYKIVLE